MSTIEIILMVFSILHCAFRDSKTWSTSGIEGVYRFLGRTWRLIVGSPLPDGTFRDGTVAIDGEPSFEQLRTLHKCIAKVISHFMHFLVFSLQLPLFVFLCIFHMPLYNEHELMLVPGNGGN